MKKRENYSLDHAGRVIKNCPHCGSKAELTFSFGEGVFVLCSKCKSRCGFSRRIDHALLKWNKRAGE